ncbi:hypothetical protein ACIBXA_19420 [Micromonospora echinaurantiaca]|uniref:hypothetical protein n=1 Tax=Micromonospora TaxID=1873 RepID=UPI001E60B836|nr:hypothetical protein [Micromonospora sp. S4605]
MSTTERRGPVKAAITVSLDGYITGPDDRPGQGLGVGGERLHYWVMGGPWTYETDHEPGAGMTDADRAYYDALLAGTSAGLCGRGMYDNAGAWAAGIRSAVPWSCSPTAPRTSPIRPPVSSWSTGSRRP